MPSPLRLQFRAGGSPRQSQIRHRPVRNCDAKRRASSHHIYAVRPSTPSRPRQGAGGLPSIRTLVLVRPTGFRALREPNSDLRAQFRELNDELVSDEGRTRLICEEVVQAVRKGRSPIWFTERNDHLDKLVNQLSPEVRHIVVLRGGMARKELEKIRAHLATIPDHEKRLVLAT